MINWPNEFTLVEGRLFWEIVWITLWSINARMEKHVLKDFSKDVNTIVLLKSVNFEDRKQQSTSMWNTQIFFIMYCDVAYSTNPKWSICILTTRKCYSFKRGACWDHNTYELVMCLFSHLNLSKMYEMLWQ